MRCDFKPRKRWYGADKRIYKNKGKGQKSDSNQFLNPFDRFKKNYRTIDITNLKYIKQGNKRYLVESIKKPDELFVIVHLTQMP